MLNDQLKAQVRTQAVIASNRHPEDRQAAIEMAETSLRNKYRSIWTAIALQIAIRLAAALIMYWITNNILPKIEGFQEGEPQDV